MTLRLHDLAALLRLLRADGYRLLGPTVRDNAIVYAEIAGIEDLPVGVTEEQLLEVVSAFVAGRKPNVASHSVCVECKLRGNVCVMVTGTPCLGPVTHAGCGALCPSYARGCYGCYGPMEDPNTASLAPALEGAGVSKRGILRVFRTFNANAPLFRAESERHDT